MTYSPTGFARGLEGGIQALAMTAANAMAAERQIDRSGPAAVARLGSHLLAERRKNRILTADLAIALARLAAVEEALSRRPRSR